MVSAADHDAAAAECGTQQLLLGRLQCHCGQFGPNCSQTTSHHFSCHIAPAAPLNTAAAAYHGKSCCDKRIIPCQNG